MVNLWFQLAGRRIDLWIHPMEVRLSSPTCAQSPTVLTTAKRAAFGSWSKTGADIDGADRTLAPVVVITIAARGEATGPASADGVTSGAEVAMGLGADRGVSFSVTGLLM